MPFKCDLNDNSIMKHYHNQRQTEKKGKKKNKTKGIMCVLTDYFYLVKFVNNHSI